MIAIAALVSLGVGWAISGDLLYYSLIGLDSSGFPLGEWIQSTVAPGATKAVGGIVVAIVVLIALVVFFFFVGRRDFVSEHVFDVGELPPAVPLGQPRVATR